MVLTGAGLQVAAGVVSVVIAALLFVLRPGGGPNRGFALVLTLSGALLVTAGLILSSASPMLYARLHAYYVVALPFAMVAFVSTYPQARVRSPRALAAALALGAAASIATLVLVPTAYWDASLLRPGVEPYASASIPKGPLVLFVRLVEIAAGAAALLFARDYLRSTTQGRRRSLLFVSLGFFVPAACTCAIVDFMSRVVGGTLFAPGAGMPATLARVHDALLVVQVGLILALLAVVSRAALRDPRRDVRFGLTAFGGVVLATSLSAAAVMFVLPPGRAQDLAVYGLWGFWSALGALLIAYGVLRAQLFDIDLRIKAGVRRGTVGAAFVATFFVASEAAASLLSERLGTITGLAAAGLLVFALAPLQRLADGLTERALPAVKDTAEYRVVRKRELYRAAVESALKDGFLSEKERDVLATLADGLGIGAGEARAIERELTGRAA